MVIIITDDLPKAGTATSILLEAYAKAVERRTDIPMDAALGVIIRLIEEDV
jgi:hypothetical protein